MNFPMDNPLFQFAYWVVNTPMVGGIVVSGIGVAAIVVYALTLRWILSGPADPREEVSAYPSARRAAADAPSTARRPSEY